MAAYKARELPPQERMPPTQPLRPSVARQMPNSPPVDPLAAGVTTVALSRLRGPDVPALSPTESTGVDTGVSSFIVPGDSDAAGSATITS